MLTASVGAVPHGAVRCHEGGPALALAIAITDTVTLSWVFMVACDLALSRQEHILVRVMPYGGVAAVLAHLLVLYSVVVAEVTGTCNIGAVRSVVPRVAVAVSKVAVPIVSAVSRTPIQLPLPHVARHFRGM